MTSPAHVARLTGTSSRKVPCEGIGRQIAPGDIVYGTAICSVCNGIARVDGDGRIDDLHTAYALDCGGDDCEVDD